MKQLDQLKEGASTWCFDITQSPAFDKRLFNTQWLQSEGITQGAPSAGRGNTWFIRYCGENLVRRDYMRGGLMQHVNSKYYVWTGLERTRAFQEMQILHRCADKNLPVPKPYACQVSRHGLVYTASLITYRLAGLMFSEHLGQGQVALSVWQAIGDVIARMHLAGIWHADLNAHNILVTDTGEVSLIDFDRAREVQPGSECLDNLDRLKRSVIKEQAKLGDTLDSAGWEALLARYSSLTGSKLAT